ncbi:MAG: DNA translocase FtsK 4TM domain-containing protein, partial [Planctomycetota bacterium]
MAKRTKKTDNPSATQALAAYRGVGWAVMAGLWLMLVAALVSYHPDDAPSHAVGVATNPVHNWVGVVGAAMAYELYSVLGTGVWIVVIGMAVYLYRTATQRETNQLVLRSIGLVMMAVTVSALIAILGNTYALFRSPMPEGTGGLLSLYVNDHLHARFDTFGSVVLLLVSFWVGAILTADKIVLAIPKAMAEAILRICDIDPKKLPLPRLNIAGRVVGVFEPLTSRLRTAPEAWDGAETDVEEGPEEVEQELTPKQLKREKRKAAKAKKKADSTTGAKRAMEAIANAEEEDDAGNDAPDAYSKGKQKLDPDALREKMAQMPINFAPKTAAAPAPLVEQDLSGYKFPGQDLLEEPETNFTEEQEKIVRDQAVKLES